MAKKRINFTVTDEMDRALQQYAQDHGGSVASHIRDILAAHLKRKGYEIGKAQPTWGGEREGAGRK